jgi:sugar phosphate isomerase/epimerase
MIRATGFGMVFDTTHWGSFDRDLVKGYAPFAEYVKNIHISDFLDGVEHIVPGDGELNLDGFLEWLVASGFDGQLTLELDYTTRGRNEGRDESGVLKDLVKAREWMERAFACG